MKIAKWKSFTFATGLSLAALVFATGAASSDVAPEDYQLRVVSHNIEGGNGFHGGGEALDGVEAQIVAFNPDVVMLEEVCASQYEAFKARHSDWNVYFTQMTDNQRTCEGSGDPDRRQGQMLASTHSLTNVTTHALSAPQQADYSDGEERLLRFKLMCADVKIGSRADDALRACVTHLRAGTDADDHTVREAQTAEIHRILHDRIWTQGQAVTVAGDFNAVPNWNAMNAMYYLQKNGTFGGDGDFHEADQTDVKFFDNRGPSVTCGSTVCRTGERTYASATKLDYAFISRNVTHGGVVSALAPDRYGSDHYLYRALFNIRF
ncbi:MAG TPA: endonuclease/exonuclease/phosphatase family protein [Nocardioides sp.]